MTSKQQRYVLFRHFKLAFGVHLTDAQLDDIQDIYFGIRKDTIFKLGMYRFINAALAFVFFLVWFFVPDENMKWFFLVIWIVFGIYNFIHSMTHYVDFKRLKDPERISDMDVNVDEEFKG